MILIVDDDAAMADTCAMLLESHGFQVDVAFSGAEALAKLQGAPHELVISDCTMPEMSGEALCQHLKADPSTAQLPILLMSASMRCEIAKDANYDTFLRKPFLAETLLAEVRKLVGRVHVSPNNYLKV